MKLKNNTTQEEITLPNDLLWEDEWNWVPVESTSSRTLSGELIIDFREKVAGRTITLVPPDGEMGWVTRLILSTLRSWASVLDLRMTLTFEYPEDTRTFLVMFRHYDTAIESKPVLGFPSHEEGSWFSVTLRFIEVV
jgi:hypothetical protein